MEDKEGSCYFSFYLKKSGEIAGFLGCKSQSREHDNGEEM